MDLETKINELEKRISAKTESVDIAPLETSLGSLETTVSSNSNSIATNTANIASHATDIANLQTTVSGNTTNIATNTTDIATNTSNIASNTSGIAGHETRISALELPDYYGTSLAEITGLESKIFMEEEYNYNGGSQKISIGTKGANGPYGTVFTRINPVHDSHYVGSLKLFMSNIPSGQTTTTLNLIINGTSTALNPTFVTGEDYDLLIPFDFYASNVSNVFKIQFTDILLVDTILDYIEITVTNGVNFAVLNRDYGFKVNSIIRSNNTMEFWCSKQNSNVGTHAYAYSYANLSSPTFIKDYTIGEGDNMSNGTFSFLVYLDVPSSTYYYLSVSKMECQLLNETSTLKTFQIGSNFLKTIKTNINQYDYSFHNGSLNTTYVICGTTLDQELFLASSNNPQYVYEIKFGENYFPSQFVQLNAVNDFWILRLHSYFKAGYIAVHNTGTILFLPDVTSDYFIVIGKGTQPNAYLQENHTTMNIYYNSNGKVIKKQLNYNATTEKWELSKNVEIFPTATEVIETNFNITTQKLVLIGKVNGTWQSI